MKSSYQITETFQIPNRGLVVVIDEAITLTPGKPIFVKITCPNRVIIETTAYQELLLRHQPETLEKIALVFKELEKSQVPIGSYIEFAT
jgi:hypothetical protein